MSIPHTIIDDLVLRFIIHMPEQDKLVVERLGFAIEEAWWYYSDFLRDLHPNLPNVRMEVSIWNHLVTLVLSFLVFLKLCASPLVSSPRHSRHPMHEGHVQIIIYPVGPVYIC